jgi:hypothetical protein
MLSVVLPINIDSTAANAMLERRSHGRMARLRKVLEEDGREMGLVEGVFLHLELVASPKS